MDLSFLKHASVYGLATILLRVAGIVLLPIYLRCLGPADYGLLDVVERLAETVGTCLLFGGFRQALMTFYSQAESDRDKQEVVSTTLTLLLLASLMGLLLAPQLSTILIQLGARFGWHPAHLGGSLLALALIGIVLEPFSLFALTLLQARTQSVAYVSIALAQVIFRIVLCIFLVRILGWGVTGALTATAIQGVVFGTVLWGGELLRGVAWPTWTQAKRMVLFALPMLPGGLGFFLLHHGDRFFLARYCPMEEIGIYGLGYKLALVVAQFSLNPLFMVWSARMYAAARQPDAAEVFGRTFTRILAAYLFLGLGLCIFAPEVVYILGGTAYMGAARIIPPVVLACFFQSAALLLDAGFYVRHRTSLKLGITLSATAVTLVLYALWIPLWGSMGAALATLVGFAVLAVITWGFSQRVFPVRYEYGRLVALLALAIGLWVISDLFSVSLATLAPKACLMAAAFLFPWYTGLVNREEKAIIKQIGAQILAFTRKPIPVETPSAPLPDSHQEPDTSQPELARAQ
jgi:O-antigen/teichoic acid export membrane protein